MTGTRGRQVHQPLDPDLAEILAEARRLVGPALPWRRHTKGEEQCPVFEIVSDDALVSRRLVDALYALCDARGCRPPCRHV